MSTRRHPCYPAEQWQAWIEEQAGSGLSQRVLCEQKGLSKSSFQLWKRRLKRAAPTTSRPIGAEACVFAPVIAPDPDEAPEHDARGWEIELDLGDGVCLRFRRGGR
ncbi:IS66 family insertion sequence element accessory protein TnpA [Halomonas sp. LBP4]|uniref:IS66 family insertion sequence element accessory protein TnpA n=1 Tax=Halomonas sp. LBP4 TaxID=2044917 RepID=UPI0011B37CB6|nr:IS66 family insertion sequence element accessory protein TnpB [Halomonas sp. LBP4]